MDKAHAHQIAQLLNSQNKLVRQYDAEMVIKSAENYIYTLSDADEVIACLELKRVQWYQFEIDHLTVAESAARKGHALRLLQQAEQNAKKAGGRVIQCTIREGNNGSQRLFEKEGFVRVSRFYYPKSGNNVGVWQKVISLPGDIEPEATKSDTDFAGIEYHGIAGSSLDCECAVVRLLQSADQPVRARILSAGNTHCLLLTNSVGDQIVIKSGFASGYGGTGPTCLSRVLQLLQTHGCEIDECEIDNTVLERLDASALMRTDLENIIALLPKRPNRWRDFVLEKHVKDAQNGALWRETQPTMPYALIDERIFDLALSFSNGPDDSLFKAYRRLEDLVRQRTNSQEHGHKLFSKAFQGDKSFLHWNLGDDGEHAGRANLFIGALLAHRNPRAHRQLEENARGQLSEFLLLNHLFGLESEAVEREK